GSMLLITVLAAAMATILVEGRALQQNPQPPQHQQQQQQLNLDLHPDHDSVNWRPHLPTGFRTGFSKPIDHGPMLEESPIVLTDDELSLTPVKNAKKKAYIQKISSKELSQEYNSRSKRFLPPKEKVRAIAVSFSIFNFLGFVPALIPGLPFHIDLPSPDAYPYRITHEVPLRVRRRRRQHKIYY
ncbi:unnamed protein product, partial [Meganyctiphanes norvegica]